MEVVVLTEWKLGSSASILGMRNTTLIYSNIMPPVILLLSSLHLRGKHPIAVNFQVYDQFSAKNIRQLFTHEHTSRFKFMLGILSASAKLEDGFWVPVPPRFA